jgi:hypothetical protein
MRITVVGAGAMGGSYGGLLALAGHQVQLIDAWPRHLDAINRDGLLIDGVRAAQRVRLPPAKARSRQHPRGRLGCQVEPARRGAARPPVAQEEISPGAGRVALQGRGRRDPDREPHALRSGRRRWTRDGGRQMRLARALKAGQVFVNNYGAGGGVELPFGGMKGSGFGREKGFEALYGFSTVKTVAIRHG